MTADEHDGHDKRPPLIKSFWKSVTAETFFQKGFWPPEAKVAVELGSDWGLTSTLVAV
ncbi:MAG: hypothetical protein JSV88_22205 [Candidatus Aminicenantes bacterium]|nr:MAG: hypothetical protein JSV88_22205 [Candidatus Aminicenantes bacterium]